MQKKGLKKIYFSTAKKIRAEGLLLANFSSRRFLRPVTNANKLPVVERRLEHLKAIVVFYASPQSKPEISI